MDFHTKKTFWVSLTAPDSLKKKKKKKEALVRFAYCIRSEEFVDKRGIAN